MSLLNVFKLKSDATPPLPPKDLLVPPYSTKSLFSRSAASLSPSLSPDSYSGPATPASPYPPMPTFPFEFGKRSNGSNGRAATGSPSPSASGGSLKSIGRSYLDYLSSPSVDGTDSSGSCPPNPGMYQLNDANASSYTMGHSTQSIKQKKSVFKLANLAKRNRSKKDLSDSASASDSTGRTASVSDHNQVAPSNKDDADDGISLPWNFQHNIHVDDGYIGLPPSWSAALSQVGFEDDEIAAIHARRRAATASALALNGKPASLHTTDSTDPRISNITPPPVSSDNVLLAPAPRSTSLGKARAVLGLYPPSIYSVATTTGPSTIGAVSPIPSPRTPSFSIKSLVNGIKTSLTSDLESVKDASSSGEPPTAEHPEQFVFINGDGPEEDGLGDESLIEPYYFDSAVSSPRARIRRMSQGQLTPRTPTFPQIQVQRTHSDVGYAPPPSSASITPSPLAHSPSLPTPTPPHGYAFSNRSTSISPAIATSTPGAMSTSSRTPSRRAYHIMNPSSDSFDGEKYFEPPPAYASPMREESIPRKEKEESVGPPSRPIPPAPTRDILGEPSRMSHHRRELERHLSASENSTDLPTNHIPGTAEEMLNMSSRDSDNPVRGGITGIEPAQQGRALSPTPPLVIDKRVAKLVGLPPRISFHQEGSLEDWSESLFSAIGKRSSVQASARAKEALNVIERRTTIRPSSPLSMADKVEHASEMRMSPSPPEPRVPTPPVISSGDDHALEAPSASATSVVEESNKQEEQAKEEMAKEETLPKDDVEERVETIDATTTAEREAKEGNSSPVASSTPTLPDVSHPNISSPGEDLDPDVSMSRSPSKSSRGSSIDSLPPAPPPKPKLKPKPAPLVFPPTVVLAPPPRMNVITGISGKSPVNPLFGAKPQPLPIPIPPAQIRAQLRPAPPKPAHPPPSLPLPPIRRPPSQPNLPLSSSPRLPLSPVPSPQKVLKHDPTAPYASPPDSRPNSAKTPLLSRVNNPGDRDSDLSMITVTHATITTAKSEVVRTAIASVVDSDVVSLASQQENAVATPDIEPQSLVYNAPDIGEESPRTLGHGEVPEDCMVSETSSVSLLRGGPQSNWPAPPPPPVELGTDSTPPRAPRFRTTSLGRVQAKGGGAAVSPMSSHSSHGSSETVSSLSSRESAPLTTPMGTNGVSPSTPLIRKVAGLAAEARLLSSTTDTFGGVDVEADGKEVEAHSYPSETPALESPMSIPPSTHPLLAQLQSHITPRDPTSCFTNLVEIAEGESGSVFAASVISSSENGKHDQQKCTEKSIPPGTSHVAIKRIPLPPISSSPSLSDNSPVSNKLISVLHELSLLKDLDDEHLLLLDAVYFCPNSGQVEDAESESIVDSSLWIRMELMERSLADVLGLVAEGLVLQERLVGRFACDVLHGLDYLQKQHIAHRDVRSDNLLVSATGVVKLADFSNAIRVDRNAPIVNGAVGVIYWQAPEMRAGPYNALKVDVWSLGATVWELAETVPPFSMPASPSGQVPFAIESARHVGSQWPPLTHPEHYSRAFHEFLRLCGRESAGRPGPGELLNTPFVRNACGRPVILQLLSQCRSIEETIAAKETPIDAA